MKPGIVLVRENAETLTCSSCAGTLDVIDAFGTRAVPDDAAIRSVTGQMGELYLALRRKFGDRVDIDVVDPRNGIYLIPRLLRGYFTYRPPSGSS